MKKRLVFLTSLLLAGAMNVASFGEGIIIVQPGENQTEAVITETQDRSAGEAVPNGMYIGYTNVGGMTREEVSVAIDNMIQKLGEQQLVVKSKNSETTIQVSQMNPVCINKDELINTAIGERGYGSLISQYKQAKDLECNNQHLEPEYNIDASLLASYLVTQMPDIERAPKNVSLVKENGEFVITPAVSGFTIDYDGTYNEVLSSIRGFDGNSLAAVSVKGIETPATYDDSVFDGFGSVLGSYVTEYATDASSSNRATNVEIAVDRINGTVLMPGEEFSYCQVIQPFSEEAGFKLAPTYNNGGTTMELGGGVCQVSTTLYDAVLYAELDVTFRRPHSKTVSYAPYGMDAMVYIQSGQDFKFVNSLDHAIYIEGYTVPKNSTTSEIHFNVIGTETRPAGRTISYEEKLIELSYLEADWGPYTIVYDDNYKMYPNGEFSQNISVQYAHPSVTSEALKREFQDGVEVSQSIVDKSWSKYAPERGVITINSKTTIKDIQWDPNTLAITGITLSNVYLDGKVETTTEAESSEDESTEDESTEEETTEEEETTAETTTVETTTEAPTTEAPTTEAPTTEAPTTEAPTTEAVEETAEEASES